MAQNVKVTVPFPFFGLLFLLFLGLKLTGYITWSWWWVTAPLWGFPFVAVTILLLILLIAVAVGK